MRRLTLAVLLMLTLVGCSAITNIVDLETALDEGGYSSNRARLDTTNGHSVMNVTILSAGTTDAAAAEDIAEIVWTNYPERYDELRISINGETALSATEADLIDRFGEHPPGFLDEQHDESDFTPVIIVTLVAALLLAGLVFLVWWRGRKPVR